MDKQFVRIFHLYKNDIYRFHIFLKNYNKYISVSVNILNKYADEGYIESFQEGVDATANKNMKNRKELDINEKYSYIF